jgi:hypothetical protein
MNWYNPGPRELAPGELRVRGYEKHEFLILLGSFILWLLRRV